MSFHDWAGAHRRSLLFLLLVAALVGAVVAAGLPSSLFPAVDFPRVVVSLDAGDQPAEHMEAAVTRPMEQALRRVPGVVGVRSTTSRGAAEISVGFEWGTDMAAATLQVDAATARVLPQLPAGVTLETRRMDPTVFPILAYSLSSKTLSPTTLRSLADYRIAPALAAIAGVAHAQAIGGAVDEFQVVLEPGRLQALGLAPADVARALAANNVATAAGKLEDRYQLLLVLTDAMLKTDEDIGQTVIAHNAAGLVRVRDVATVRHAPAPEWTRVTADGHDAVLVSVYQQPGGNSVRIGGDVKKALAELQAQLPPGIVVANWYDQGALVRASAASVRDAILVGALLAAGVLLVFLRSFKVTLVAVIVVPAVLAITVLLLALLNMSFNVMTLGGMAAAVGLIIDDAIVMTEHIVRRLRERRDAGEPEAGGKAVGADDIGARVRAAATQFLPPLAGSSAATLVIFAPLAFLTGVTGAFFKALSITMAGGLFISFVVTAVAVPLLAGLLLDEREAAHDEEGRWSRALKQGYERWMRRLLARPAWIFVAVLPLAALGALAFTRVGSGFMPAIDEGGFVLDYQSAPGTALSETDRLLRQVEQIILATPDVLTFSRRTGTGLGGGLGEANGGDFFIRLKDGGRRPVEVVMEEIRQKVETRVPGLSVEMAQLMEDLIGDLTAVPQPVEIKLFGDDPAQLARLARAVAARLGKIAGVVDVRNGINPAGDALEIHVDRALAALEDVDPATVAQAASDGLSGALATQVLDGARTVNVRVVLPAAMRSQARDLAALALRAPDGHVFPLGRIAHIETVLGQPQIGKENLRRLVAVTARLDQRDLGSVMADVKKMLATPGLLPAGVHVALGGLYEQQQQAFRGLLAVFAAAAALVFLLLLFIYERFTIAIAIVATSLLSVCAVFIGLWLTGIELNITAMMGMTMVIGIVTEVGIFYFSEQRELEAGRDLTDALVLAGRNRMRPIAMTTLAAILTLLPLAFAVGQGSEMQQPLAVAIISGLVVQLPLVLFALPAFHALMQRGRPGGTQRPREAQA